MTMDEAAIPTVDWRDLSRDREACFRSLEHALSSLAAQEDGGANGKCMVIDTEGAFRPERLQPIAERFGLAADAVLETVTIARAFTSEHQARITPDTLTPHIQMKRRGACVTMIRICSDSLSITTPNFRCPRTAPDAPDATALRAPAAAPVERAAAGLVSDTKQRTPPAVAV